MADKHTCTPGLIGSAYGCPGCGIGPQPISATKQTECGFCTMGYVLHGSQREHRGKGTPCPYCDGTGLAPQGGD